MSNKLYNDYMTMKYGGNKMVRFIQQGEAGYFHAKINQVDRFIVIERQDFSGGWDLMTLNGKKLIKSFRNLGEVETYIEEMDK